MTHEQAAAFAAKFAHARRSGLVPEAATARSGYRELALESEESRHRAEALTATDDDAVGTFLDSVRAVSPKP